jgi:hypothetical protein
MGFGFLVADQSGGLFNLALSDGGSLLVLAVPGGGSGQGFGELIFPTIAALSAFNVANPFAFPTGQKALVQSNQSTWTLQLAPQFAGSDGITQVTATGAAGAVWSRDQVSNVLPDALIQGTWYVDPENLTTRASDENVGNLAAFPLLSKAEIARRWGGWSPTLEVGATVKMLSSDSGSFDPWLASPTILNGQLVKLFADLPPASFIGTLNVVTPKNVGTGVALASTFNTVSGAVTTRMLLINIDRGNSRCWTIRDIEGGNLELSQPVTPYVDGTFAQQSEVDTWQTGDRVEGFEPLNVDVGIIGGKVVEFSSPDFPPSVIMQNLTIYDPEGEGNLDPLFAEQSANFAVIDCLILRATTSFTETTSNSNAWLNCWHTVIFSDSNVTGQGVIFSAGTSVQGGFFVAAGFQNNFGIQAGGNIITEESFLSNASLYLGGSGVGLTTTDTFLGGFVWGPGFVDAFQGVLGYAGAATGTFQQQGALMLNTQTTGYSNLTTAGVVAVHQVALTPAALDAASGAAGFGGFAWGGGAAITNGAQP